MQDDPVPWKNYGRNLALMMCLEISELCITFHGSNEEVLLDKSKSLLSLANFLNMIF